MPNFSQINAVEVDRPIHHGTQSVNKGTVGFIDYTELFDKRFRISSTCNISTVMAVFFLSFRFFPFSSVGRNAYFRCSCCQTGLDNKGLTNRGQSNRPTFIANQTNSNVSIVVHTLRELICVLSNII
jgi:hypothetical protein